MKICPKCGALCADTRTACLDCGTALGKKLTGKALADAEAAVDAAVEHGYRQADELRLKRWELVLGILIAVCFVGAVLLLCLVPKVRGSRFALSAMISVAVCAIPACLHIFFPRFFWKIEAWKLSFFHDIEDAAPSTHFLFGRKLSIILLAAILIGLFVFGVLDIVFPAPEPANVIYVPTILPGK